MKTLLLVFLLVFCTGCISLNNTNKCNMEQVHQFSKIVSEKIARHYNHYGKNIETKITSCEINSEKSNGLYIITMETHWKGAIMGSPYQVNGILKVHSDGSFVSFQETYKNENVKSWDWHTCCNLIGSLFKNNPEEKYFQAGSKLIH